MAMIVRHGEDSLDLSVLDASKYHNVWVIKTENGTTD